MSSGGPKPTPYDDAYPRCERAVAKLRMYAKDLEPDRVSAMLGIEPTSTQRRGQEFVNSLGLKRTAPIGGWFLSSEGTIQSRDLARHLDWLLDNLRRCAHELLSLQREPGVSMNISCIWWLAQAGPDGGGIILTREQMRTMADLNLEWQLSISYYGDDPRALPPGDQQDPN